MKKITLSIMLLMLSFVNAQNAPITFESGAFGNTWGWSTFEDVNNPALEIVANPSMDIMNTSATVAKFTALQAGMPWAGCQSAHGADIGTFTLSASNCTVKIMVWKSVISDVGIKFATGSNASTGEIKVANTLINQWEELTFDFSSKIGEASSTGIDQIIIFPDFQTSPVRTGDNICYFDNIRFSPQQTTQSTPMTAAPTPTRPAANVISMYSNAYTNVAVDTWLTNWSVGSLSDIQIQGNDTKKYQSVSFVGVEATTTPIDASSMLYFHVDAWTPNMTSFKIKLVDFGANAIFGGGDDVEHELTYTPVLNGWNSYEIALTDFTGLVTKSHIAQLIFSGSPAGTGIVYIDNVYFHNVPFVDPNVPMTAAPTPTRPAADVISMFSNAYTNVPVDTWHTSWSSANLTDLQIQGNDTKKYTSLDFVGVETVASMINASGMSYFHVDAWTPNMTVFRVKLVDFGADAAFGGGDDVEHELTFTPTLSGWNSYDIALSDFTGLVTKNHIAQLIFSGTPTGAGILFIDNVYFASSALGTSTFVKSQFSLYPNPTASSLNIESVDKLDSIEIYSLLGQRVLALAPDNNKVTLDVAAFNAGVYLVKATSKGVTTTSKLVVE